VAVAVTVVAAVAAVAVAVFALRDSGEAVAVPADGLAVGRDRLWVVGGEGDGARLAAFRLTDGRHVDEPTGSPGGVVAVAADARGSTWVLNDVGVHRLAPGGDGPSEPIDGRPVAVELDADRVWVLDVVGDELVLGNFDVDGGPEALTETVGPAEVGEDDSRGALAVDAGEAWVSDGRGTLARLPSGQGRLEEVEEADGDVVDIAVEGPWAWAATAQGSLLRIDRTSLAVTEVEVSRQPLLEVVAAGGVAWTADAEGEVRRVPADATEARAAVRLDAGRKVLAAADDGSAVYVANAGTGRVDRLDPDSGRADDARRIDLTDALG
jgi:hypothetical protein